MPRKSRLAALVIGVAAFAVMAEPPPQGKSPQFQEREFVVYFNTQSADVTPEADSVVAEAVRYAAQGAQRIIVVGCTDTAEREPTQLSRRRAHAVGDSLYRHGLPDSVQVIEAGIGPHDLAVRTGPATAEALNRRVTLDIK